MNGGSAAQRFPAESGKPTTVGEPINGSRAVVYSPMELIAADSRLQVIPVFVILGYPDEIGISEVAP